MDFTNFTIKSQEEVKKAETIAKTSQHQAIENGHLLKGLLTEAEDVTSYLLKKLNVNVANLSKVLDKIVESYPKVVGGETYLSSAANNSLQKAIGLAKTFGDQFVSVEHILIGILQNGDNIS